MKMGRNPELDSLAGIQLAAYRYGSGIRVNK